MADWNSELYLKFKKQRTQPAIDLAQRVSDYVQTPSEIIDLGCGPGNSTRVLKNRFPNAHITGADNSANMIEKANADNPDLDFITLDISGDLSAYAGKYDVVFSNACLQWVQGHETLLPRLFELVRKNGVFAVQIPMNYDEPIHQIIKRISESGKWNEKFPEKRIFGTKTVPEYFDILSDMTDDFELWKVIYCHRMPNIESIIDWYRSTGLRTYLAALDEADGAEFIADISKELEKEYPMQKNGEIIFRFPRFFFIAKK